MWGNVNLSFKATQMNFLIENIDQVYPPQASVLMIRRPMLMTHVCIILHQQKIQRLYQILQKVRLMLNLYKGENITWKWSEVSDSSYSRSIRTYQNVEFENL